MKNKNSLTFAAFLLLILFSSCRKENSFPEGTYSGNFSIEPIGANTSQGDSVTLTISGRTYSCSTGETGFAIMSNGTFKTEGQSLIFKDKVNYAGAVNKNFVLDGQFTYTFHDDQLSMVANFDNSVLCRYTLQKIR